MSIARDVFLAMSTNSLVRRAVVGFPLSRIVSRRFVAGETLDEAIGAVKSLNGQNLRVTLDVLGESVSRDSDARAAKDQYIKSLDAIAASGVTSNVSVKLTQMGLQLNHDLCLDNMHQIVSKAKQVNAFARIDMEDSKCTAETLDIYKALHKEFDNVGIVIQAYLFRSEPDMQELHDIGGNVRLCKGAYKEPPTVAFPDKKDVDNNYVKLAQEYLTANGHSNGAFLALATHDEKIINWAKGYVSSKGIPKDRFEFQMLYGIRQKLQKELAAEGYGVRVYVPYGSHWYPYFMRRLAERPANVVFLASNLFRQ